MIFASIAGAVTSTADVEKGFESSVVELVKRSANSRRGRRTPKW